MKTLKKAISILISLCLIAGLFVMTPMSASAEETAPTAPHTYELYDYFDAYHTAFQNNTPFVNTSAWSMEVKKYNSDTWINGMVYNDTATVAGWNYINAGVDPQWGYVPGFGYQYNVGSDGRYMDTVAMPANFADNPDCKFNAAYTFTAPQSGLYSVGQANQSKVLAFDDTNSFHKISNDEPVDMGVRITVDGNTIWPTSDMSFYSDGWAVFGNNKATIQSIAIPVIEDIRMNADSVLRVEFTAFDAAEYAWNDRILGMVSVKYDRPMPTEVIVPTTDQLPIAYETYDFLNPLANGTFSESPWSVDVGQNGVWHKVDTLGVDGDYRYLRYSGWEWGGNWPGIKFYRPANYETLDRYYFAFLTPCNYGTLANTDSAYTFKTPFTGNYSFGKSSRDKVLSFDEMDYIRCDAALVDAEYGVRITIDGQTIWPQKGDGWVHFGTKSGLTNGIEIPELDLFLKEGQVLRMETRDFAGQIWPWYNSISGIPSMTLKQIEGTAQHKTREFEDAGLYLDELSTVVNTYFSLIDGDKLYSKNVATSDNDSVSLQVKADSLGSGIKIGINGFNFVLNGANSSITSPAGAVETKTIPVADNGIYNIYFDVLPAFAGNAITGTLVCATINGVSYEKLFTGEISEGTTDGGIIFENNTGTEITIMPGAPLIKVNSGMEYNNNNRVLYVGDTTDLTVIKGLMENSDRYFFNGDVVTGNTFIRKGNDSELMTYSFAVKGDVNSDGLRDVKDLVRMKKASAEVVTLTAAQNTAAKFGDLSISDSQAIIGIIKYLLSK